MQSSQRHAVCYRGSGIITVTVDIHNAPVGNTGCSIIISNPDIPLHQRLCLISFFHIKAVHSIDFSISIGGVNTEHTLIINLNRIAFAGQIGEIGKRHFAGQIIKRII